MKVKKKYYSTTLLLALSVGILIQSEAVYAASDDELNPLATGASDTISPEFNNLDEALRAANLAREGINDSSNLKESLTKVESAQASVNQALKSGDQNALAKASMELEKAEEALMNEFAYESGVIKDDILSMRDRGMEWWQVGHELGMHSEMNGYGHRAERAHRRSNAGDFGGIDEGELTEATEINSRHGWSLGHGLGIQAGVHNPRAGFMGMGNQNDSDSTKFSGAGGMWHKGAPGSGQGARYSMGGGYNDGNHDNMNNMNDNHNSNMNNNMNDNHNSNMNNNMNDNHNSNMNNNMNDNHNNNSGSRGGGNHNSGGWSGGGGNHNSGGWSGSGDHGKSSGGHGGRGKW